MDERKDGKDKEKKPKQTEKPLLLFTRFVLFIYCGNSVIFNFLSVIFNSLSLSLSLSLFIIMPKSKITVLDWAVYENYSTPEKVMQILINFGVPEKKPCPKVQKCQGEMHLCVRKNNLFYRCGSRQCNQYCESLFHETLWQDRNYTPTAFWHFFLAFLYGIPNRGAFTVGMTQDSMTLFRKKMAEICQRIMSRSENYSIGGPDKIIQVDESCFARKKHHQPPKCPSKLPDNYSQAWWVIGGIEQDTKNVFLELMPDRTAKTIQDILERRIKPGSILKTDGWKSYPKVANTLKMKHIQFNHSKGFANKDGETTNQIEGTRGFLKRKMSGRNWVTRDRIQDFLHEGSFNRKFLNQKMPEPGIKMLIFEMFVNKNHQ